MIRQGLLPTYNPNRVLAQFGFLFFDSNHLNPSSEVFGKKRGEIGIFEKPDVVISGS